MFQSRLEFVVIIFVWCRITQRGLQSAKRTLISNKLRNFRMFNQKLKNFNQNFYVKHAKNSTFDHHFHLQDLWMAPHNCLKIQREIALKSFPVVV